MRVFALILLFLPTVTAGQYYEICLGWPVLSENKWLLNKSVLLDYKSDYQDEYFLNTIKQRDQVRADFPYLYARFYTKQFLFIEPELRFSKVNFETNDGFSIVQNNFISGVNIGVTRPRGKLKPYIKLGINSTWSVNSLDEKDKPILTNVFRELWHTNKPMLSAKAEAGIQYGVGYASISYSSSFNQYDPNGLFGNQTEMILFNLGIRVYKSRILTNKKIKAKRVNYSVKNKERMTLTKFEGSTRLTLRTVSIILDKPELVYAYFEGISQHVVKINRSDFSTTPIPFIGLELKRSLTKSNRIYSYLSLFTSIQTYKFNNAYKYIQSSASLDEIVSENEYQTIQYSGFVVGGHFMGIGARTTVGRFGQIYIQTALSHWLNIGNDFDDTDNPGAEVFPALKTYIPAIAIDAGFKYKRIGMGMSAERSFLKVHPANGIKGILIYQLAFTIEVSRN